MSCDKVKLTKIVESSLANKRAEKDLMGMIGIKGAFDMTHAGVIQNVIGEGFTVVPLMAPAGAFYIYFDKNKVPYEIIDVKISCFQTKVAAAAASDYAANISGWNMTGVAPDYRPYVTGRGYVISTGKVALPAATATFMFQICGIYSNVGIYE